MHPTLNAMVAAEREVDIARTAQRRGRLDVASPLHLSGTAPLTHDSRGGGPTKALGFVKTALAGFVSRPIASPRTTAGREMCCA